MKKDINQTAKLLTKRKEKEAKRKEKSYNNNRVL